jgi:alkylhydroperoxidase family enzyme
MFNLQARWDVQALKLSQARNAVQYNVSTVLTGCHVASPAFTKLSGSNLSAVQI